MMHIHYKLEAISNIAVNQLQSFIGLISYFGDMWKSRNLIYLSSIVMPQWSITSNRAKLNRNKECQKVFDTIEELVSRETLLSYLNNLKM